jgi:hypothetical protein
MYAKPYNAYYMFFIYTTTIHSLSFDPNPSIQVRSYCRGIVVRAVPPATRQKLFARLAVREMASLRSFLDPPVAKGKTVKGSGQVGYNLHKRNHTSQLVLNGSILHQQVMNDHLHI